PLRGQVRVIPRAEEALATIVDVVPVLVPPKSVPAPGRLDDLRRVEHGADRELKEPWQVRRAVRVGERDRLLGCEAVAAAAGVILDKPARRLRIEPFAHVTFGGIGAGG